jgi:hypothetical protein
VFVEIFDLFNMDGSKPTEAFIYFDSSLPKPLSVLIWAYPGLMVPPPMVATKIIQQADRILLFYLYLKS